MSGQANEKQQAVAALLDDRLGDTDGDLKLLEKSCSSLEKGLKRLSLSLEKNACNFEDIKKRWAKAEPDVEKSREGKKELEKTINAIGADIDRRIKEAHELVAQLDVRVINREFIDDSIHNLERDKNLLTNEILDLSRKIGKIRIKKGVNFDGLLKQVREAGGELDKMRGRLNSMEMEFSDIQVMLLNLGK